MNTEDRSGRGEMMLPRQIDGRRRSLRLSLIAASMALLSALAGCSSSSSVEYATDAFPSQSLVDLMKGSTASPAPAPQPDSAQPAAPGVPPPRASVATAQPPGAAAPAPPTTAAAAPAPPPASAPQPDADPVAAAFPSVSLIDLVTGAKKPAQQ
jgi:hypothetical protein